MPSIMDVGRSRRTPAKHALMSAICGKEVGAAGSIRGAGGSCERCQCRPPTEPHHLRYPPWGAFDVPENLIAVCHPCHCEIHGKVS